jgi:flagellar biosynthesis chaperone FliJ
MSIDGLDEGMLPDDMHGKSKTEIKQELEQRAQKRAEAQKEIADLAKQRDEYIKANQEDGEGGFDKVVKETLETQLK